MAMVAAPSAAFHVSPCSLSSFLALKAIHPRPHGSLRHSSIGPQQGSPGPRRSASPNNGARGLQSSEKGGAVKILIPILGVGFVFGGLFPLINNGLNYAKLDSSISGAATGLKQKEIDEKLKRVPAFAVTDDQGTPYVAEYQGKNRGYFFLNPKDAEKFRDRVKELQTQGSSVSVRTTTLDEAIKYIKSKANSDPFEILPYGEEIEIARGIKNPENCDICWGAEGVKEKIPVYLVEGLGLQKDSKVITPLFFDKAGAESFYRQASKTGEPKLQVLDLSALIKKMRKGGSTEFRKVVFFPNKDAIEYATGKPAQILASDGKSPSTIFPPEKP
ncbi:member of Tic22 family [Guillardia theta CCMP2712]|uniref:Member of Tic22 family n=2 Tax=Guillardia theta TaxID=55529 RepID=L1K3Z1_GUITC|nr:member of Tic22 family [Guillardia theta CCMP2712]EKX55272.1 member of Tic22 family [Guillardia theta CCMP2712]|eukprot:XP_005842252.1 member of Tic22 family [Guillardia theta CCMP2712]